MNDLETFSLSRKRHCSYYGQKIAQHTPPKSEHDERMIRLYQRCLKRDRAFLRNLDLLNLITSIRKDAALDVPIASSSQATSSAALNLDEFRALLDENDE
jgi:hypothetical protein